MMAFLEHVVTIIYKFFAKRYLYWLARRSGYKITSFEWLPDEDSERIMRITPTHDNFPHTGDDCRCEPEKTVQTDDKGAEYILIKHREMVQYDG